MAVTQPLVAALVFSSKGCDGAFQAGCPKKGCDESCFSRWAREKVEGWFFFFFFPTSPSHLRSIGGSNGLRYASDLVASPEDALAGRVANVRHVLILELSALPNLHLTSSAEDANSHGGEEVVGGVGVQVNTAVEDGGGILADGGGNEGFATGVLLDEVTNIVDDTGDGGKLLAVLLAIGDEIIPVDDGELLEGNTPVESSTLLIELLLELLDAALFDFVGAELLEIVGKAELLPDPDVPLGGVVLPPLDGVAVIRGELVVEVVVALAEGDQGSDDVVTGRVAVIKGLVAEPVGQRVDAEGSLLDEENLFMATPC